MEETTKKKITIEFYRMDMCPKCKHVSLELYDYFNNPMGYHSMIDCYEQGKRLPEGYINKRDFYTIRCKHCGTCFPIIWRLGYPFADCSPLDREIFLKKFKAESGR